MEQAYRKTIRLTLLIGLALMIGSIIYHETRGNESADSLWQIINGRCVTRFNHTNDTAPCAKVDQKQGYALYKAMKGSAHYLLLPLQPISGIESEQLFSRSAADYLALAWHERQIIAKAFGSPMSDNVLAVTINSVIGRSQNQLHVHLSCLHSDIRARLQQWSLTAADNSWQPVRLRHHDYLARVLSTQQMEQENLLKRIAREIPNFRHHSGEYGVALTRLQDGRMVLLVVRQALLKMNFAHPEELQDSQCVLDMRN